MKTILVTGGTGLVGRALSKELLKKGYSVIILTRNPEGKPSVPGIRYTHWDVEKQVIDKEVVASADHIIHLAGAGVAEKRWTAKRKAEIVKSRVDSGKLLVNSLQQIPNKVKSVISASAIGWYGPDPQIPNPNPFKETDRNSADFLGNTCRQWEESIAPIAATGIRLVKFRIGIVLSKEGGALKEFIKPLRFGVAAILGSGKQMVSWLHIGDVVSMLIAAVENENIKGVFNAVAPLPVSNKELTIQLARSRKRFCIPFHVPSFLLKWMLGEMSVEILKSATVNAEKIQTAGFSFQYPDIKSAMDDLVQ